MTSVNVFAELAARRPWSILAVVGALAVVAAVFGLQTPHLLGRGSNEFVAQGSESLRAEAGGRRGVGLVRGAAGARARPRSDPSTADAESRS